MTTSQAIVRYRYPLSPTPHSLHHSSHPNTIAPARLFSAATGTAIATELLYRILMDIINRILYSLQAFASRRLDQFSSYLEQRAQERREFAELARLNAQKGDGAGAGSEPSKPGVVEEVKRMLEEKDRRNRALDDACPMGARGKVRRPGPPFWVENVLKGAEEGRMQDRDFWIQAHVD